MEIKTDRRTGWDREVQGRLERAVGSQIEQIEGAMCEGRREQGASKAGRPGRSRKEAGKGLPNLQTGCSFQAPEAPGASSWLGWSSGGALTAATSVGAPFEPLGSLPTGPPPRLPGSAPQGLAPKAGFCA